MLIYIIYHALCAGSMIVSSGSVFSQLHIRRLLSSPDEQNPLFLGRTEIE